MCVCVCVVQWGETGDQHTTERTRQASSLSDGVNRGSSETPREEKRGSGLSFLNNNKPVKKKKGSATTNSSSLL